MRVSEPSELSLAERTSPACTPMLCAGVHSKSRAPRVNLVWGWCRFCAGGEGVGDDTYLAQIDLDRSDAAGGAYLSWQMRRAELPLLPSSVVTSVVTRAIIKTTLAEAS